VRDDAVTVVNTPAPDVLLILMKSDPFHAQTADSPFTIVTPVVGPTPRSTIDWVLELLLMTV
jgi:hypothetical protein